MPSQRHSGLRGVSWSKCDRCKFDFPLDQLQMQDGLLLCPKDVDNETQLVRQRKIRETLAHAGEEPRDETARVRRHPNLIRR